jgi:predicted ArsR family transcriptional regulator
VFIEFTLSAVLDTLVEQDKHQVKHQVDLSGTQIDVLKSLQDKTLSRKEIFAAIGMNGDSRSFKRHIEPLIAADLIEMTVPDKPNSPLQKYRLTDSGKSTITENRQ